MFFTNLDLQSADANQTEHTSAVVTVNVPRRTIQTQNCTPKKHGNVPHEFDNDKNVKTFQFQHFTVTVK